MSDTAREETIDDLAAELTTADWAPGRLIDVRGPEEFATGHVPGAVNTPLEDVLADPARYGNEPVHVICQSGRRSLKAVEALTAAGVPAVSVAGGTAAWIEAGREVDQ